VPNDATDTLTYLHSDHLGSASLATNSSGGFVSEMRYDAYGETRSGSMPTDRQYTGQINDSYIKLYHMGARMYDPELGRFISPDSIVPDFSNPQSLNRYSYVLNNALKYTDPTGHRWMKYSTGEVIDERTINTQYAAEWDTLNKPGTRPYSRRQWLWGIRC